MLAAELNLIINDLLINYDSWKKCIRRARNINSIRDYSLVNILYDCPIFIKELISNDQSENPNNRYEHILQSLEETCKELGLALIRENSHIDRHYHECSDHCFQYAHQKLCDTIAYIVMLINMNDTESSYNYDTEDSCSETESESAEVANYAI